MKLRALIALLFILSSIGILAQGKAKVSGLVTDEEGNPLEIVNIHVEKQLIGTVSDLKGRYSYPAKTPLL